MSEITVDQVDTLVRNGKEITQKIIEDLKHAKESGGSAVVRMTKIIASGGKSSADETSETKARNFKKETTDYIKALEDAIDDEDLRASLTVQMIADLKVRVLALAGLIPTNN